MKKLLFSLMIMLSGIAFSQSTINPDTVCINTPGSTYSVPPLGAGFTYAWTVLAPGVITAGQGTDNIVVDWSAAGPGLIPVAISVVASSASGCDSPPVELDVFILEIIPTITALGPFCETDPCVPLVGTPAGGVFSGPGVVLNGAVYEFCPTSANLGINTITYTVSQGGCTFSTTTDVDVTSQPVLGPISHN